MQPTDVAHSVAVRAVNFTQQQGTLVVAAGGNEGMDSGSGGNLVRFRRDMPGAIGVAATAPVECWALDPTGEEMPFGIDRDIVGDSFVDFRAGVIARFDAPVTADDKPDNGLYDAAFEYFQVRIGDTTWDQTMPGSIQFHVTDGAVNACFGPLTVTMPEHPGLSFAVPASPGTWEALDQRGDVDLGVVTGTYSLRDATVPEPSTLVLLALGVVSLAWWRRRAWMQWSFDRL